MDILKEFLLYLFEQRQLFESVIATNQHLFFIVASSLLLARKERKSFCSSFYSCSRADFFMNQIKVPLLLSFEKKGKTNLLCK